MSALIVLFAATSSHKIQIVPSIFDTYDVVDEYTLAQKLGDQTLSVLEPHWESWVTQEDFNMISGYGFNMVRIPIGFWAYDNAGLPYVQGAAPYIDYAVSCHLLSQRSHC